MYRTMVAGSNGDVFHERHEQFFFAASNSSSRFHTLRFITSLAS